MKNAPTIFTCAALAALAQFATATVTIDWVTVGNINNPADPTTDGLYGGVDHAYNIGKYEVTIGQYTEFLNAKAAVPAGSYQTNLWASSMATNLNIAGISRSGSGTVANPYVYATIGSSNRPITWVSWFDAARFANWMSNGQGGGSTETGTYNLNGATEGIFTAQPGATIWLPTENEWYKAAYYQAAAQGGDADNYWLYPTASNTLGNNTPGTGAANYYDGDYATTQSSSYSFTQNYLTDAGAYPNSDSYYGTFDQGGNVWEWNDAVIGSSRGLRGGSWDDYDFFDLGAGIDLTSWSSYDFAPTFEARNFGFRVASVPEPTSLVLTILGSGMMLVRRKR